MDCPKVNQKDSLMGCLRSGFHWAILMGSRLDFLMGWHSASPPMVSRMVIRWARLTDLLTGLPRVCLLMVSLTAIQRDSRLVIRWGWLMAYLRWAIPTVNQTDFQMGYLKVRHWAYPPKANPRDSHLDLLTANHLVTHSGFPRSATLKATR